MIEKFDIAGYARISVDEELDRDNTSIENQKSIIKDYVERNFPGSRLTFYEDRDRSGYTFEEREGYQQMRPKLLSNQYDILIVKDFSRFSRRNSKGLVELEDLKDAGVRIISIGDSIDYPTYDDWTAIQFRFLVNEMPVTDASKKVKSVIKRRQETGKWICALPYGYVFISQKNMTYKVEESEAEVVCKIFSLYIDGWGYKKIADYLTDNKIPTPRMSERARKEAAGEDYKYKVKTNWSVPTIQGILQNDFYIGTLRQGKYTRKKINGKEIKKDISEHKVFPNAHEPIIDEKTFLLAQQMLKTRTKSNYRGTKKYDNFYSGIMECGDCGAPMFPMSRKNLKEAYRCGEYHKHGAKACSSHHIRVETLNAMVKLYLIQVRNDSAEMLKRIQKNIDNESESLKENQNTVEILSKQLDDAREERKTLTRQQTRELMRNPEREDEIYETYDELIGECDARIEGLENQITLTANKQNTIIEVNRIAKVAINIFDEIIQKDKFDKRDLSILIDRIYVYDNHITVKLQSDIECILKSGTLPELEKVVNFNSGIIDSLNAVIVQKNSNKEDKVYDVNVISNGDPLEIYTATDGEVIFKKYSPVGELSGFAGQYADVIARISSMPTLICDNDHVIAAAGASKREFLERRVSTVLENYMENRKSYVATEQTLGNVQPVEGVENNAAVIYPIISSGDVMGAVVMLSSDTMKLPTTTETKLAQSAAAFLGKQMED